MTCMHNVIYITTIHNLKLDTLHCLIIPIECGSHSKSETKVDEFLNNYCDEYQNITSHVQNILSRGTTMFATTSVASFSSPLTSSSQKLKSETNLAVAALGALLGLSVVLLTVVVIALLWTCHKTKDKTQSRYYR